jgi:acyl-CoA synthetase (AMP-forming)/AMP-acid ligase II
MFTDFLAARFDAHADSLAVIAQNARCTYRELLGLWRNWLAEVERKGVAPGTVVALEGEFSPSSVALFLALVQRGAIVVPQSSASTAGRERKDEISQVEVYVRVGGAEEVAIEHTGRVAAHALYAELRDRGHPGLVLFSSGTSGDPKAAVHDFTFLLEKYHLQRPALSTLTFLLFDHWGGLNTMLHAVSNGSSVIAAIDRSPAAVCKLIEEHRIELLPATPTFLNLLLLSGAHRDRDLSSLKVITYGAEPMPESTLARLRDAFPTIKLQQTYGLIEVGVLRSKSRDDGSLWVKLGGEGYETRVVDGILQIKTRATILGYLNAPTPITPDGWFVTGDAVLQDGDYFRVLGRESELINVGGEKVYPAEVESLIQSMAKVADATVYGEKNALVGQIVCARVAASESVDRAAFADEVKRFCSERLEPFKVPVKVQVVDELQVGDRFKKRRVLEGLS